MEKIDRIIFHGHILDVYGTPQEPLFLAVEVARLLDYSVGNTAHMLETVNHDEKLVVTILRAGQKRAVWFLTEDGLYEVLMQSRKPIARRFKLAVKKVLRDMRHDRNESMSEFFGHLDHQADLESLNALREDMNLPDLTMEEYLGGID